MRRSAARRGGIVFAAAWLVIVWGGCAPTVVFLGDPVLGASLPDPGQFEADLSRAASAADHRLVVEWDPSQSMTTTWLEQQLEEAPAPIVALSPYFSLFASDLAPRYPDLSLVAFRGSNVDADNLVRVDFDRIPALEEAGRLLREWVSQGADRRPVLLYLAQSESSRDEASAIVGAYGGEGSDALQSRSFERPPEREAIRSVVRDLRANGVNAFLVFLGPSNRFVLELLQTEPVVFATDAAAGLATLDDALLFSVEERLDTGLAAALEAAKLGAAGQLVVAKSEVVKGGGFSEPQLHSEAPEDPEENAGR